MVSNERCKLKNCRNTRSNPSNSFYTFPKDEIRRRKWLEILNLDENDVTRNTRICQDHFNSGQFATKPGSRLKKTALPKPWPPISCKLDQSVNLLVPSSNSTTTVFNLPTFTLIVPTTVRKFGNKQCFICNNFQPCETTDRKHELRKNEKTFAFLLKTCLDIPNDLYSQLWQEGDPFERIYWCNGCSIFVDEAMKIKEQMKTLQKQFENLRHVLKKLITQSAGIPQHRESSNQSSAEGIRSYVSRMNHQRTEKGPTVHEEATSKSKRISPCGSPLFIHGNLNDSSTLEDEQESVVVPKIEYSEELEDPLRFDDVGVSNQSIPTPEVYSESSRSNTNTQIEIEIAIKEELEDKLNDYDDFSDQQSINSFSEAKCNNSLNEDPIKEELEDPLNCDDDDLSNQINHESFPDAKGNNCGVQNTIKVVYKHGTSEKKQFSCTRCEKKFSKSEFFNRHMECHRKKRTYSCYICGKSFYLLSSLHSHKSTHARVYSDSHLGIVKTL